MSGRNCREELLKAFNRYDTAVDIVSCWESFLDYSYGSEFKEFHFERFPEIPSNPDPITPDFAAYFNDGYGVIGEIKRTLPNDPDAFKKSLNQIQNYDEDLDLQTKHSGRDNPENVDIFLLISGSSAPEIGVRISNLLDDGELSFDNNLVLLRYNFNTTELKSRYEFQRVTELDMGFQDDSVPDRIALSQSMGKDGNYETLPIKPEHFFSVKVKQPICNDSPPGHYLATILWNKIFPKYLDQDKFRQWNNGSIQKIIEIKDTESGFCDRLNQYVQNGRLKQTWVGDALDFLCDANLAYQENGKYHVEFRGMVREVGAHSVGSDEQNLQEMRELGHKFVDRYCEYTEEKDGPTQTSFEDFSDN